MTSFQTLAAIGAAFSIATVPVAAAEMGVPTERSAYAHSAYDVEHDRAERHRRWRDRDRVDAGDVIAGIAIIGGIAAIASAIDGDGDRDRYPDPRYDDYRGGEPLAYRAGDLDRAAGTCVREVERDVRVESIDQVSRVGDGWQVRGRIYDGSSFTCSLGRDGRIDRIDYDSAYAGADYGVEYSAGQQPAAPGQWSDEAYAEARRAQGDAYSPPEEGPAVAPGDARPAYPGGPLPGEDEIDGDFGI